MKLFHNLWLLIRAYPIAKRAVLAERKQSYQGTVLTQICYNEVRTSLVNQKILNENITGAIIYLSISLAYLLNKN
jgi:hypothetical protein